MLLLSRSASWSGVNTTSSPSLSLEGLGKYRIRSSNPKANRLVGPSGLEPPTLRLSVVRSSQLSYGPSSSQSPLASVSALRENSARSLAPPLQITNASLVCDLSQITGFRYSLGGDSRDRTGDLLLARQALSQLSYIPSYLAPSPSGPYTL